MSRRGALISLVGKRTHPLDDSTQMVNPYMIAPHADPGRPVRREAPNAALLIDFDNVTMGMRSDLAKELKNLLDSDIIKGKVTVQRAYADWRRYPQYIVPLSEASIDLIFAPAYGSSKKNATDIRMAIDGIELVFIRPEIGTFILLTGDSDFSSLVLKLKEYGKYVVGIGIQESSSDILVQNCDEYYSYTALTGLSKTSEDGTGTPDAWQCVEAAVARMVSRGDVMRSDRLKQVIMELSPTFDERNLGYKKFSKFLVDAANKGLLGIERAENGQYLIAPAGETDGARPSRSGGADAGHNGDEQRKKGRRASQPRRSPATRARKGRAEGARDDGARAQVVREPRPAQQTRQVRDPGPAIDLLTRAVLESGGKNRNPVRDSDAKRKMLSIDKDFNESAHGFGKFSKFLQYAEAEGLLKLKRSRDGSYSIRLIEGRGAGAAAPYDAKALGLPTTASSIKSYLANRYKGVGVKTAERLVDHFGADVFKVLHDDPNRVRKALSRARADSVLDQWANDFERRSKAQVKPPARSSKRDAGASARTARPSRTTPPAPGGTSSESTPGHRARATVSVAPVDDAPDPAPDSEKPARSGLMSFLLPGRRTRGGGDKP